MGKYRRRYEAFLEETTFAFELYHQILLEVTLETSGFFCQPIKCQLVILCEHPRAIRTVQVRVGGGKEVAARTAKSLLIRPLFENLVSFSFVTCTRCTIFIF